MSYIQRGFVYKTKKKQSFFIFIIIAFNIYILFYTIFFFFLDIGTIENYNNILNSDNRFKFKSKHLILYNNGLVNMKFGYNDIIIYSDLNFSFKKYYFDRIINRITFGLLMKNFYDKYHLNLYKIVGKEGDVISIKKGNLFVNNKFIKKIELPIYYDNIHFKLFRQELFCISTNDNDYFDSLVIGALSKKKVTGKIIY